MLPLIKQMKSTLAFKSSILSYAVVSMLVASEQFLFYSKSDFFIWIAMRQLNLAEKIELIRLSQTNSIKETTTKFNSAHRDRPISRSTVGRVRFQMFSRGSLERKKRSDVKGFHKPFWYIPVVNRYFIKNPHTTLKQAARKFKASTNTIRKILKQGKFKPYKCVISQELYTGDEEKRKRFCNAMLRKFNLDPTFKSSVLWTDESLFTLNGIFNRQNFRYYLQILWCYQIDFYLCSYLIFRYWARRNPIMLNTDS